MKTATKIMLGITAAVTAVMQSEAVQAFVTSFISHHPALAAVIAGASTALALIHQPSAN